MGCTTSTEARHDMVVINSGRRAAARSLSLPSVDRQRLRWKAASVLASLGISHGRHSGAFKHAAATTSVDEEMMMKSEHDRAAEAAAAATAAAKLVVVKPHTRTLTPPNEPEVINAWELMAGLEDDDPPITPRASPPMWMQSDMDVPIALEFDPEILSGFREALADADTSPSEPTTCSVTEQPPEKRDNTPISPATTTTTGDMPELSGIVRARINAFQEKIERRSSSKRGGARVAQMCPPPGGEGKAVVYFTSLRGVRKTFVDCCAVRSILRSYGVRLDERDVSMHAVFRAELLAACGGAAAAEDVHTMHEAGELARALEGCEAAPVRKLGYMEACAACGDVRFVPCETCYGSCKVFVDGDGEFRRCTGCNENGLIRCPVCCC
uniref:Glutaredoxin domain-containing protein n=1 Tax=Leersia perrieri TaxID=77586 RepID=A0A0D9WA67_9ORYZ